eukprot:g20405.t1
MLAVEAAPDELGVDRYEEKQMQVRASANERPIMVARPNLVVSGMPQRAVEVAPPLVGTKPPALISNEILEDLRADAALEPDSRVGVTPRQLLTLKEAIEAISSALDPAVAQNHPARSISSSGFESDCDSDTDDANFELARKGQFVPAAGGKQSLQTMATYKTQYRRIYEPLMKACGLSRRRENMSTTSLDILYRTMRICGDFPQSRHLYYSQIKGHTEMTHALPQDVSKAYDKYFVRLLAMRKKGHQQRGLRASDMLNISNVIGGSEQARNDVVMQFDHGDKLVRVTAELAFRFVIACWYAFLRPDCAGHTSREYLEGGNGAVRYKIFSSKTDQRGEVAAETIFECNCRSIPTSKIPLCPVHCISCEDFDGMQRVMKLHAATKKKKVAAKLKQEDEELLEEDREAETAERPAEPKWHEATRRILVLTGIDNPRIGGDAKRGRLGRHAFGPYSVRIGGCQSARDSGTDEDYIQCIGRWISLRNKEQYKGLACALRDSVCIEWPIRVGTLYNSSTNYNSESDWARQAAGCGYTAPGADDSALM